MKNPYKIVNRAVKEHLESGAKLVPNWHLTRENGKFGLRVNGEGVACGCPLAMVIDGKKIGNGISTAASKTLSKNTDWIYSFISGFDRTGCLTGSRDKKAFQFGQRLRDKHEKLGNMA